MQFSDDDDDDDDDQQDRGRPRVTRLDQPSQVTVAPDGQVAIAATKKGSSSSSFTTVSSDETATRKEPTEASSVSDKNPSNTPASTETPSSSSSFSTLWTHKGGATRFHETEIIWSQDRDSVTLRVLIPAEQSTKAWQVTLRGRLSYADRNVGVGSAAAAMLEIRHAQHGVLLPPTALPHAIHKAQGEHDEDDDASVDWTIERDAAGRAYIAVTLCKAAPMAGVVVWWNRPLVGAEEIEMSWRTTDGAAANFQQVWDQAHEQFRAKLAAEKNGG